jgi:hypothetical protein
MEAFGGMNSGGAILGLDPSSTCIGHGALSVSRQVVEAGIIRPAQRTDPSWDRIMGMYHDLLTLFEQVRPGVILVEWTKGKVGARHGGLGAGLAVYGCGVGAAGLAAYQWGLSHPDCRVEPIHENDWTRGVPKQARQLAIASLYPEYAEHLSEDPGGDMADGLGLADWYLRERRAAGLWD